MWINAGDFASLDEMKTRLPRVADMPNKPLPPLHPGTKKPVTKEQMSAIFAEELIDQEMSLERFIDIPEEVQEIYRIWRPTPLVRATGLEKALGTPAKIYFKNESVSPAGSHKPNTAVPQAYYNHKQGIKRLTTETGAGQWGASIAFAAKHFGLDVQVFMVKVSYEQKPYRRLMMNTWGAECIASPSTITASGRAALERDPNCSGSLGLAISEAVEMALQHPEDTRYCLGSVLNHVLLHQTVIGQEAVAQMEMADAEPDVVIGCFGGGSNFAGLGFPFLRKNLVEGRNIRIVAVEPASCPKLTRGSFQYDFGDVAGFTPLLPMYTLGHDFQPSDIHAGGLRYHGAGSIVSQLLKDGLVEARSLPQTETLAAGILFAKTEGIIPAPESTHAIAAAIREALQALLCRSGRAEHSRRGGSAGRRDRCRRTVQLPAACRQLRGDGLLRRLHPPALPLRPAGRSRTLPGIRLHSHTTQIRDVVITASEVRGPVSGVRIGREAMQHLQPSSFEDLLELLPGGRASDPSFSGSNHIRLREAATASSDYSTSALGVSFLVDGAPLSNDAALQYSGGIAGGRSIPMSLNAGIDMRTLATDEIASVEIIQGIPSVEYGDLTSGLVKIRRKEGGRNLEARFKADLKSQLLYLGKGFEWGERANRLTMNLGGELPRRTGRPA